MCSLEMNFDKSQVVIALIHNNFGGFLFHAELTTVSNGQTEKVNTSHEQDVAAVVFLSQFFMMSPIEKRVRLSNHFTRA